MSNQYDSPRRQVRQMIVHAPSATGLSVPGTAASDTVLLRIPISTNVNLSGTARLRMSTGGTAAGPTITVGKSLAGTGAVVALGTYAFGTSANGAVASIGLTSTDFDPGDEVVISNVAGTAASTPVIIFSIPYNLSLEVDAVHPNN
jgi:hypothetical protein